MATLNYWDGTKWSPVLNSADIISALSNGTDTTASESSSNVMKALGGLTEKEIKGLIEDVTGTLDTGETDWEYKTIEALSRWITNTYPTTTDSRISSKISDLDSTISATTNNYISAITQVDGKITSATKVPLPITGVSATKPANTNGQITVSATGNAASSNTITVYEHPDTNGTQHIPSDGKSGQYLGYKSEGTAEWKDFIYNTKDTDGLVNKVDTNYNKIWRADKDGNPSWGKTVYYGTCSTSSDASTKNIIIDELSDTSLYSGLSIFVLMDNANEKDTISFYLNYDETDNPNPIEYDLENPYWEANSIVELVYINPKEDNVSSTKSAYWTVVNYNNVDSKIDTEINGLNSTIYRKASLNDVSVEMQINQTGGTLNDVSTSSYLNLTGIGTAASKNILDGNISGHTESDNLVSSKQVSAYVADYTNDATFKAAVVKAASDAISADPTLISAATTQIQSGSEDPSKAAGSLCMMYIQYDTTS